MKKNNILKIIFLIIVLTVNSNVYALECSGFNSGSGTKNDPYVVTNSSELYSISCNPSSYFILNNDIDLTYDTQNENGLFYNNGRGWIPLNIYNGGFDGGNHKIKGLYQNYTLSTANNMTEEEVGLFGLVTNATIKNLKLEDVSINLLENKNNRYGFYVGVVASYVSEGNLINIETSGNLIYTNKDTALNYSIRVLGGVVGRFRVGEINSVVNNINITYNGSQDYDIGGIVGALTEEGTVLNSQNNGNISSSGNTYGRVGGLIGESSATSGNITIDSCVNNGKVFGAQSAGIASEIHSFDGKTNNLLNLANYGVIESYKYFAGGIVGIATSFGSIEKSFNAGTIITNNGLAGGIAARSHVDIVNCYNVGDINVKSSENNNYIGGIVGEFGAVDKKDIFLKNSYSINLFNNNYLNKNIGAIVGKNYGNILNSYYYKDNNLSGTYDNFNDDKSLGLTFSQMKRKINYNGYDFDNVWYINYNSQMPFPQFRTNEFLGEVDINKYVGDKEDNLSVGDMNNNGKIDLTDVIMLLKLYVNPENQVSESILLGDMNNNGKIDLTDVIILLKNFINQ